MEQTYGIGVNNRYELFYDQDDVQDFETVITKNKKKAKEPAKEGVQTPNPNAVQQKSVAEKENKQIKKATLENGTAPQKASVDQPRRGIKEQQNNSNKDNSTVQRKDGGEYSFYLFWTNLRRVCVYEFGKCVSLGKKTA
jgi:hypothetical protein